MTTTTEEQPIGKPISSVVLPDGPLDGNNYQRRWFSDLNTRKREITGCDFSFCVFERGYFRKTRFKNCKFVGARFLDCSFRGAELIQCNFEYATFHNTLIDADDIVPNLPGSPNQRRDLLQALRANAQSIGDHSALRRYVLEEMAASIDHHKRAVQAKESYYKQKYVSIRSRVHAQVKLVVLRVDQFIWGHGERPFQILFSSAALVSVLALINAFPLANELGWRESGWGLRSLEYCVRLFLEITPDTAFRGVGWIDYPIGILRYLFLGLAASVLFKLISHR